MKLHEVDIVLTPSGEQMVRGLKPCPFCADDRPFLKSKQAKPNGKEYFYLSCRMVSCIQGQTRAVSSLNALYKAWQTRRCVEIIVPKVKEEVLSVLSPQQPSFFAWLKNFFLGVPNG